MTRPTWFEIPAYDIHRAAAFYSALFDVTLEPTWSGAHAMALFPADGPLTGALVAGPGCVPASTGVLLYLDADGALDDRLVRIAPHGGRVVMERTLISDEVGSYALIIDSEGNRLALHEAPAAALGEAPPAAPMEATSPSSPDGAASPGQDATAAPRTTTATAASRPAREGAQRARGKKQKR